MKIYLAGKVTGLRFQDVFLKFNAAEYRLKREGYTVVNPLRLVSQSWEWEKCMRICLAELLKCDAIYLLSDWEESEGAKLEYYIAQQLKLKILA
jgi:hypothetical protein